MIVTTEINTSSGQTVVFEIGEHYVKTKFAIPGNQSNYEIIELKFYTKDFNNLLRLIKSVQENAKDDPQEN